MSEAQDQIAEGLNAMDGPLFDRVNFTLVRDYNYGGFAIPVKDDHELQATRTVAKELMVENETQRLSLIDLRHACQLQEESAVKLESENAELRATVERLTQEVAEAIDVSAED